MFWPWVLWAAFHYRPPFVTCAETTLEKNFLRDICFVVRLASYSKVFGSPYGEQTEKHEFLFLSKCVCALYMSMHV